MTAKSNGISAKAQRRKGNWDRAARKLVQWGFLALLTYPAIPVIYARLTMKPAPTLTSWILPWDPLLFLGHLLNRNANALVWGAPLVILAATWVFGRFFCGWVCPLGTLQDLIAPLARWHRKQGWASDQSPSLLGGAKRLLLRWFPPYSGSPLRYYILVLVLASSLFSLKLLGLLDPLVIASHGLTVLLSDVLAFGLPPLRAYFALPVIFLIALALELWQPRFWCRHLCPLGALLSLFARGSLICRRVSEECDHCGDCRRACSMRAIPDEEVKICHGNCAACEGCEWGSAFLSVDVRDPYYLDCQLCLECEAACPKGAISIGLATGKDRPRPANDPARQGEIGLAGFRLSRREFLSGAAVGAVGLAFPATLKGPPTLIRPPGALPEEQFVRTCIACQECVRVCPTGGLKPVVFEAGWSGFGTPKLHMLQGACSLNPSCPHLCAKVCPVGAILSIEPQDMKIGIARVNHPLCLGWDQETKCLVCVEACVTGAAQSINGRIIVDAERCTGCGRCENACPVAGSAIKVYPLT